MWWWVERWPFAWGSTGNRLRAGVLLYPAASPNAHCARNVYFSTCLPFSWCLSLSFYFMSFALSFQPPFNLIHHLSLIVRPTPPSYVPHLHFPTMFTSSNKPGTFFGLYKNWYLLHYLPQKYRSDMIALLNHISLSRFVNILFCFYEQRRVRLKKAQLFVFK